MKNKLLLIIALFIVNIFCNAQTAGDLDTSFGSDGKVMSNFGQADFFVRSQAIQTDGKIIIAGDITAGDSILRAYITRLNSDGSLDTSFGTSGKIILDFMEYVLNIKIQSNGKILIGGAYNSNIAIYRINQNGSLDSNFDGDGILYNSIFGTNGSLIDFGLQSNEKIIVLTSISSNYKLTRYNTDGSIDSSFGIDGSVTTDIGNFDSPRKLIIQLDDKILVGGNSNVSLTDTNVFISRHDQNGDLDVSFNSNGKKIINFINSINDVFYSFTIQSDNKVVLLNHIIEGSKKIAMVRLNSNGSFDTSFGIDGIVYKALLDDFVGSVASVKVQNDNKIIVLENTQSGFPINRDITVLKFNQNGTLDSTFDFDGVLNYSFFSLSDNGFVLDIFNDKIFISGNTEENKLINKMILMVKHA
jgi:uncharacterized delta-60 repeat protein